ncbi:DMTF1 [Bugula neritina]|uniref:DMTF1 n=1 Tax=Bugula neritina TaxID=10212 RepID=A0A7J7K1G5_BUGNE|nr:DMTF1 [Bugula neritina]
MSELLNIHYESYTLSLSLRHCCYLAIKRTMDGIGEETKMSSNVIYTTKQFNIPGINENLGHSDMTSDCSILASDVLQPISFCANEDGETVLITLEDTVISDQEISITDASNTQDVDRCNSLQNSSQDVLLVTTGNEHSQIPLGEACGNEKIDISQNWFTSKTDKQTLQENGHRWRQGQWTAEENELLKHNINLYCEEKNIDDPNSIIFEMTKDRRKDFYRAIATGLDRPLFSVYRRVLRMYDQKNHMGKYTPEEILKLKHLRQLHGNDWATIGAALGRSAGSVRDRCRLMKDSCRYGTWQHDEEVNLANAVYELSGAKPGQEVHHGLSWADVAAKVKTRTDKQCRAKWLNFLNWKQKGGAEWSAVRDDSLLIEKILHSGVSDESSIDWVNLSKGWSCVRSPQWLRSKWWTLKRHVPNYQTLPFNEILTTLAQRRLLINDTTEDTSMDEISVSEGLMESSKLMSGGTTTFRLCNSADGYKLTQTVQLPDGSTAVYSDDISLDSNSFFIASSFSMNNLGESVIVQALPSPDSTPSSTELKPDVMSSAQLPSNEVTAHGVLGASLSAADEDMVVMLGDQGTDSTLLAPDSSTLPKPPLRHLSSLADPLLNSQSADLVTDN